MLRFLLLFCITITFQLNAQQQVFVESRDALKLLKKDKALFIKSIEKDHSGFYVKGSTFIRKGELLAENHKLKDELELAILFAEKGIDTEKTLVIYDDGTGWEAGGLYWLMDQMGVSDVRILSGGMNEWLDRNKKYVTRKPVQLKETKSLLLEKDPGLCVDMPFVKKHIDHFQYALVDTRNSSDEGSIPGSFRISYQAFKTPNGSYKSIGEISLLLSEYSITRDLDVIVYHEDFFGAGYMYALLKAIGYPNISVYTGGFSEWQSDSSNRIM